MNVARDTDAKHFFEVYGPFPVELKAGNCVKPSAEWWSEVVDVYEGPSPERAIGCYMFTLGRDRIKPWYIGKTIAKGGFRDEAFTDHKLAHYNDALRGRRGPAQMFFFPLITSDFHDLSWKFSNARSSASRLIEWLERTLIGMALARNPNLQNLKDTTFLRTVRLRGIIGANPTGRPHGEVEIARRALLGQ